jgi:dihydrofolate reductase
MARLVYGAICSLDGYVADEDGRFEWAAPDAEVHAFVNERERAAGTYLYGRRMYDTMAVWETMDDPEPVMREYAEIWRAADKVVYSRSLDEVRSTRTRIEREFSPDAVRELKASLSRDITIGGAELAGQALAAGLVDQVELWLGPMLVGGGTRALPDGVRVPLRLVEERRFGNGVVFVSYAVGAS